MLLLPLNTFLAELLFQGYWDRLWQCYLRNLRKLFYINDIERNKSMQGCPVVCPYNWVGLLVCLFVYEIQLTVIWEKERVETLTHAKPVKWEWELCEEEQWPDGDSSTATCGAGWQQDFLWGVDVGCRPGPEWRKRYECDFYAERVWDLGML